MLVFTSLPMEGDGCGTSWKRAKLIGTAGDGLRWGFEHVLDVGMGYDIKPTHYSGGIFADDVKNGDIDVVIHISCDHGFWNWPRNEEASKAMKANKDLQIICMHHQLEQFGEHEKSSAAWGDAAKENRLQYVVLSHHVRNYLKSFIRRWAAKDRDTTWHRVPVEMFAPVSRTLVLQTFKARYTR